jgi:hypothetical protein
MHIARSLKEMGWNVIRIIEQDPTLQLRQEMKPE